MDISTLLIIATIITLSIFEIVSGCAISFKVFPNKGLRYLIEELTDSKLNPYSKTILSLPNNSKLEGSYISSSFMSIIFPYYIECHDGNTYRVRFLSNSYFLIHDRFKSLKNKKEIKRNKFD